VEPVSEVASAEPPAPAVRARLEASGPTAVEFRLPITDLAPDFSVRVSDAATGEVLGASPLTRYLSSPWDVRYPYKDALFASTGYRWPLTVRLSNTLRKTLRSLTAEAAICDADGWPARRFFASAIPGGLRAQVDGSGLRPGIYKLRLSVMGPRGRRVYCQERPLRVLPRGPREVVCAPGGDVLVDGKPLYPIGMYWVFANPANWLPGKARADEQIRELAACGVNTLHSYAFEHNDANDTDANALAYLDTAELHGLKVMMGIRRDWYQGEAFDLAAIERRVQLLKSHPALLAWTLWDEPNFDVKASRPRVKAMYDLIDRLDPYHPAMPVFGGPEGSAFRDCMDVFLYDNYPGPGGAAQVTQTMRGAKTAAPEKPIWFVAQSFRWPGGGLPSGEDMTQYWRNAVDEGAKAVFWYSYGGEGKDWDSVRQDDAFFETFKRVNRELADEVSPGWSDGAARSGGRTEPRCMGLR